MGQKVRALSLLSGGLDSVLAVCVLKELGVDVTGVTFVCPFFGSKNAEVAASNLEIAIKIVDFTEEHLELVRNPPHGYGKQMNPCIDCHALMIRRAGEIFKSEGYDFVATGEVLGERPMSQNRQSLDTVARDSTIGEFLLRPLSAKLLSPTKPEIEGLVDREHLLAIEGRSRKPQLLLAKKYGIKNYMQPAGGCLLTDPGFSKRLRELFEKNPNADIWDVNLLKLGRHFRFPTGAKAIVGRDQRDNERIEAVARSGDVLIAPVAVPGPTLLLVGNFTEEDINLAAVLCASYSDNEGESIDITAKGAGLDKILNVLPLSRSSFDHLKI